MIFISSAIVTYFFRGNLLSSYRLLFPISSKVSFICTFPETETAHTTAFDGRVVDHWLERKISQTPTHTGGYVGPGWAVTSQFYSGLGGINWGTVFEATLMVPTSLSLKYGGMKSIKLLINTFFA